jgi:putative ABC transport system permease protein
MLYHYLKIAFRQFIRQPVYSLISIAGLSIGLATCLLILVYVADELRYDRFHAHADRIYLIRHSYPIGDTEYDWHETARPLAQHLAGNFPEVAAVTTTTAPVPYPYRVEDKLLGGIETIYADSSFFRVFDFPLLAGNAQAALADPHALVISARVAHQFFGGNPGDMSVYEQALGRSILLDNEPYTITAVIQTPPAHSHLQFGAILSVAPLLRDDYRRETWLPAGLIHYLKLNEGIAPNALQAKFTAVEREYLWPQMEKHLGASIEKLAANTDTYGYSLEPITAIHLFREGYITYVYVFSGVGLLILLLACANFVNLATARAMQRAKEVGIRKTLGSSRKGLVKQFMTETALYSLLAAVCAAGILILVQEPFAYISGKVLDWEVVAQPWFLAGFTGFILLITLLAGLYLAFYLPAFDPVAVLKGKIIRTGGSGSKYLRNGLLVFQFTISTGLIICSVVVYQQVQYMREKDPGFTKENILMIANAYSLGTNKEAFRNTVSAHPQVSSVSFSYAVPSSTFDAFGLYKRKGTDNEHQFFWMSTDYDYLPTYGMEIRAGRNFSPQFPGDSSAILLNEEAARRLGGGELIGTTITDQTKRSFTVVGIVQDFHFTHLKNRIDPLVIKLSTSGDFDQYISVRLKPGGVAATVRAIESHWQSLGPEAPFDYRFMDEKFNALFQAEQRMSSVMRMFTGLSLGLACLGLLGLSMVAAGQRTREIGIRKVLGASVEQIVWLLSRDFIRLIVLAFGIAVPLSWYVLQVWLDDFAYRISVNPWIFVLAGIVTWLTALLTIGYQAVKAASANPVESLRSE